MQPLVLAVQNGLALRDLGAGTAASTFFRSLGGALGVATLGAILATQLEAELKRLMPPAIAQLPAAVRAQYAGQEFSIQKPATVLALPDPMREAVQQAFVNALGPVFLTSALVTMIGIVLTLMLPDKELHGAEGPPKPKLDEEDDELAAAEMEANAAMMV
jgi:hypothetical protein